MAAVYEQFAKDIQTIIAAFKSKYNNLKTDRYCHKYNNLKTDRYCHKYNNLKTDRYCHKYTSITERGLDGII
jgi:hypothetical protein